MVVHERGHEEGRGRSLKKAAVEALVQTLESRDGMARQQARERLVAIGRVAARHLAKGLTDDRPYVRWEAANALVDIRDKESAVDLVKSLEDLEFDIRWLAAKGLITRRRDSLEPLFIALEHHADSEWLRDGAHHVVHVLSEQGLRESVVSVVAALEGRAPSITVPNAAKEALDRLRAGCRVS